MLSSGALANLVDLQLGNNQIGDTGMIAFVDAIKPTDEIPMGALAKLTNLDLAYNKIGDDGMKALSDAIAMGGLGCLQKLELHSNPASDSAKNAVQAVASSRGINLRI
jgi:Leucine-rich repeat (LRR) protein